MSCDDLTLERVARFALPRVCAGGELPWNWGKPHVVLVSNTGELKVNGFIYRHFGCKVLVHGGCSSPCVASVKGAESAEKELGVQPT